MRALIVLLCLLAEPGHGDDYVKARIKIAIALKRMPAYEPLAIQQIGKKKQIVEVWSATWCEPCKKFKADIEAGHWDEFEIVVMDFDKDRPPENMTWLPAVKWKIKDRHVIFPHSKTSSNEAIYDREKWKRIIKDSTK